MTLPRLTRGYAPLVALLVVAAFWLLLQRATMGLRFPIGYDEAVYVSQVSTRPHMFWSAPRAYGLPLLLWPLAHQSASTAALRAYVRVVSAAGLVLAYRPWTRVRSWSAVAAAFLFATLWVSTYYASLAMPNLVTALAAVAAVGFLVRWLDSGQRRSAVGCAVAVAVMSLVRPSDATYVAVPLLVALPFIGSAPARRRALGAGALGLGLAAGWGMWVGEAFANFGGPLQRLHEASAEDGGGLFWNLPFFSRVVSGPVACCMQVKEPFAADLWWWALWPLALLGVWLASGAARRAYLLCVLCAGSVFAQYLFLIRVEAPGPRTLLPVYALLSLPVGECMLAAVRRRHSLVGGVAVAGVAVLLVSQVVTQQRVARTNAEQQQAIQSVPRSVSGQLRRLGVRPPCILAGPQLPQIAYQAGCHELTGLPDAAQLDHARRDGTTLDVLLWSEEEIAKRKAEYDRALGVTPRVIPRRDGRLSYLYELTP